MVDLEGLADKIMRLDWGCGCCSDSWDELKSQLVEILRKAYYAPDS